MKRTHNILLATVCTAVAIALVMVVLFESDVLPCGMLEDGRGGSEFVILTFMELLTLCSVPVALRLMKFGYVAKSMTSAEALLRWGLLRLSMLCLPMVANTLLYYLYMNVAFGYMAIILLLCLAFVWPTKDRCEAEVSDADMQNTQNEKY